MSAERASRRDKPDLAALRAQVSAIMTAPAKRAGAGPAMFPSHENARFWVAAEVAQRADIAVEWVREDQHLTDLGLDGLDRISLALELERVLRLASDLDCSGWVTVGDVVAAVLRMPLAPSASGDALDDRPE